jgi:hypothetical protein
MKSTPAPAGYSAQVRLHLVVGETSLELASIGPEQICLRHSVELPPGPTEVVMHVDNFERRWQVYLPDGSSLRSQEVRAMAREFAPSAT